MATYASLEAGNRPAPVPTDGQGSDRCVRGVIAIGTTALALNDILDVVKLPAECVPVDVIVDSDDLDSNGTPLIAFDVGFVTGTPGDTVGSRTCGSEFAAADTVARAGGITRTSKATALRIKPANVDRSIGIKVQAAAATAVVQTGTHTVNRGLWQPNTAYAANDFVSINGVLYRVTTAGVSGLAAPGWNEGFGLTTADGSAVWTCSQPVVGVTLFYRPARYGS